MILYLGRYKIVDVIKTALMIELTNFMLSITLLHNEELEMRHKQPTVISFHAGHGIYAIIKRAWHIVHCLREYTSKG